MPWLETSPLTEREAFIQEVFEPSVEFANVCRQYGISRKTGYKWLHRYLTEGMLGLQDRSRCPHHCPRQKVHPDLEEAVVRIRTERRWGARKIRAYLLTEGWHDLPSASTIHAILERHRLPKLCNRVGKAVKRFVAGEANDLWQMDFKGPICTLDGFVEPLTVLDDHSRYSLSIHVCSDKRDVTIRPHLVSLFREYGLPCRILADNGKPWGGYGIHGRYATNFSIWLLTLGISLIHSRPYHPQTCGKEERFHRSLKQELTGKKMDCTMDQCQERFDNWRHQYNYDRPHEALGMDVPANHYFVSGRPYPEIIPEPEYLSGDQIKRVQQCGRFCHKGHKYRIGRAFYGYRVALRDTENDHIKEVYFYHQKVAEIDLKKRQTVLPMSPNDV